MNIPIGSIVSQFEIEGCFEVAEPIVAGHINDTFLIRTRGEKQKQYILQRINHTIFTNVPQLQNNILRVTSHIRKKLQQIPGIETERRVLTLIAAKDGKWYVYDDRGNYWRMMHYIAGSHSYNQLSSPDLAYIAGLTFGEFDAILSDLPGEPLFETIRDFHNIEFRLQQFREAIQDNKAKRSKNVRKK
jgi:hypothetical protein